jgi:hypothetical protein
MIQSNMQVMKEYVSLIVSAGWSRDGGWKFPRGLDANATKPN